MALIDDFRSDFSEASKLEEVLEEWAWEGPQVWRGYTVTVIENAEGEGGPSSQQYIFKLSNDSEERFLLLPVEWVSWDGMYYEETLDGAREVFPVEKTVIVYE